MNQEPASRKQGAADAVRLTFSEAIKAKTKRELLRRLAHIQHLAKQKNYGEIERLLEQSYV